MIQEYRSKLERLKGQKDELNKNIAEAKQKILFNKKENELITKAQAILQKVAKQTQDEVTYYLSNIITTALNSIFEDNYEFRIDFIERRGRTEAEMHLVKDGMVLDPMASNGGGIVDVISFALRITIWNIIRNRNTIILDEPLRYLSKDLQIKAGKLLKLLSEKLNLQFIIVTHENELVDAAEKIFNVSLKKGISEVKDD